MTKTQMAGIHDTSTCDADGGRKCELCVWAAEIEAEEREQQAFNNLMAHMERVREIDRAIDVTNDEVRAGGGRLPEHVALPLVRMALADVLNAGDRLPGGLYDWVFYLTEDQDQTDTRIRFIDAVVARVRELEERG